MTRATVAAVGRLVMGLLLVAAQRQSWGGASKPQYPYPRSLNLVGTEPLFAITLDGMDDQADRVTVYVLSCPPIPLQRI